MTHAPPPSPLLALAAQWQVLSLLAVAIGRRVSLAAKMRSRAGAFEAEMLEAFLYTALIKLSHQIAAYSDTGAPLCPEEAKALDYLKSVHMQLSVLTLLTAHMRRELEAVTGRLAAFAGVQCPLVATLYAAQNRLPGYLDSS